MRVPLSLLSQYVTPVGSYANSAEPHGWDVERLVDRLVMTGTEVEAVEKIGPASMEGFVVGHVRAVDQHPDADRLRVCQVDVGGDAPQTIVCGAANVAAGQVVPVVLPGAVMPGGMKIKKAKLRGVPSEGMICSEAELGISPESVGIMVLAELVSAEAEELRAGRPLGEVLSLSDTVIELEVTPNRSDCFGLYGIAREVAAITGAELGPAPWQTEIEAEGQRPAEEMASIEVAVPELCPRFTATVFDGVQVAASPTWLKQALTALGQRPINNVVDITNYVMLVTGQPLHAFDLDRVAGSGLVVRRARADETVTTLDEVQRQLDEDMVVVCDADGPAAIAGIMGGAGTEVQADTTRLLLEVASWDGPNILASSRRLSLRSEASSRFERQLHPALCDRAQRLAAQLLIELTGASMAPGTIDVAAEGLHQRRLELELDRVTSLLGVEVPTEAASESLRRLGFSVAGETSASGPSTTRLTVAVPVERHFDVTRQADLIEEIGRLHGYENLPATIPSFGRPGGLTREQRLRREVEDALRHQGFDEVVGWSFTDPSETERLRQAPGGRQVSMANPLSTDQSVMRTSLLGSLLDAAAFNISHGADRVALFESGRVYLPGGGKRDDSPSGFLAGGFGGEVEPPVLEPHRLAAVAVGSLRPSGWDGTPSSGGFFALKAVLETLAGDLGLELDFEAISTASGHAFLHPGRAATVGLRGLPVGWIGELHPGVAAEWDLPEEAVVAFELDLAPLIAAAPAGEEIYADVTSFPAVRQDLAIVVAEEVSAGTVRETVLEAGHPLLKSVDVFDLYRGDQLGQGMKSLALRLAFQAADRTLTEEEVTAVREEIETAVKRFGGSIRE